MERPEEIDRALLTAVEHAEEAQVRLIEEPLGSTRSVKIASSVVHRVEDVDVLAGEARVVSEEAAETGEPAPDGT